jgi:hypothetical protein
MGPLPKDVTKGIYHVARCRTVFTYEPAGLPAGVVTGYPYFDKVRGRVVFFVEHIISFVRNDNTLLGTLSAGLRAARDAGYDDLVIYLYNAHPQADGLASLAHRYKFKFHAPGDEGDYWVKALR